MKPRKPISRLTNPSILRQVDRGLIRRLLEKFSGFLDQLGIELPPATKKRGDYDFNKLSKALLAEENRPEQLLLALEAVGTMADIHGAEILQRTLVQGTGEPVADTTAVAADLALRAYLDFPEAFDSALMEKRVVDTRRYQCFIPAGGVDLQKADFSDEKMTAVETDLSAFFGEPKGGCQIIPSGETGTGRWFIIIHGGRRRREPTFEKGARKHVEFHPETDDVVRINTVTGEMWIHAKTKRESEAYRKTFGRHLLGNEEAFIGAGKIFTLEPLRARGRASLITTGIEGCPIESIELREVEIVLDAINQTIWKMTSKNDLFDALDRIGGTPKAGQIRAARFLVKFHGNRKKTRVTVRLPAGVDCERDSDSEWIETWLSKQGFRLSYPWASEGDSARVEVVADAH